MLDIPVKICLLQAVTVPARHSRFIRAMIGERFFLQVASITFQPKDRLQQLTGLLVEEPVIPAGQEVTLMIINPGMCPIHLQEGRLFGEAQAIDWILDLVEDDDQGGPVVSAGL